MYNQYVESRKKNGESTSGLSYETMAKSLKETTEKLSSQHAGKRVEFDVAVKDGKTVLKPQLK